MNEKLRTLQQVKIKKHKDKLEEISETASKEFSNERTLNKINDDWAPWPLSARSTAVHSSLRVKLSS